MNRNTSGEYSPIRAKRRQSDAKWRASVATCYSALKYVVPNVKHLSKRKISKALILQECEKHIKDLEDSIRHMLDAECESKDTSLLWKEGVRWSPCTLEKLRADFSEKQRQVFHTSAQGRRCYNLLQDIKEEVFNMKADPKRMAFVSVGDRQNSCGESLSDRTSNVSRMSSHHFGYSDEKVDHCEVSKNVTHKGGDRGDGSIKDGHGKPVLQFAHICFGAKDKAKVRQQPRPRQRLTHQDDVDGALLRGWSKSKNYSPPALTVRSSIRQQEDQLEPSSSKPVDDQSQIVPCMAVSPSSSSIASTALVSAPANVSSSVSKSTTLTPVADESRCAQNAADGTIGCKTEKHGRSFYIFSDGGDYTYLLRALESEKEQEVPSTKTPLKTVTVKRPRLSNSDSESETSTGNHNMYGDRSKEESTPNTNPNGKSKVLYFARSNTAETISDAGTHSDKKRSDLYGSGFTSHLASSPGDNKMITDSMSTPQSASGQHSPVLGDLLTGSSRDPMLSSLSTPSFNQSTPLFYRTENDLIIKRPPKFGSARKKLNFNSQSHAGGSHNGSRFLSPDRTSPLISGFTPIKLPDDMALNSDLDNPFDNLTSPWKVLSSPFNSRTVPQGLFDCSSMIDLDDSLLCLETMDFDDSHSNDQSQQHTSSAKKTQKTDERSSTSPGRGGRLQPKCRRRLERYYDQPLSSKDDGSTSADNIHVVPEMDLQPSISHGVLDLKLTSDTIPRTLGGPSFDINSASMDCSDFDGFYFYYRKISEKLKDKLSSHDMQSATVAAKVAHMWTQLPDQDKVTMSTLASLEGHHSKEDDERQLSQDLEDVEVEPLDPQEFIPAFI